jgi:hypothetical protein
LEDFRGYSVVDNEDDDDNANNEILDLGKSEHAHGYGKKFGS